MISYFLKFSKCFFAYFYCSVEILKLYKLPQNFSQKISIEFGGGGLISLGLINEK